MKLRDITKKNVKATSAFHENPYKPERIRIDKYANACLTCTKPSCNKGYCELTGNK